RLLMVRLPPWRLYLGQDHFGPQRLAAADLQRSDSSSSVHARARASQRWNGAMAWLFATHAFRHSSSRSRARTDSLMAAQSPCGNQQMPLSPNSSGASHSSETIAAEVGSSSNRRVSVSIPSDTWTFRATRLWLTSSLQSAPVMPETSRFRRILHPRARNADRLRRLIPQTATTLYCFSALREWYVPGSNPLGIQWARSAGTPHSSTMWAKVHRDAATAASKTGLRSSRCCSGTE